MAPMLEGLVRRCGADGSVRVNVLTDAGRTFCAGADVAALKAAQAAGMRRARPPQPSSHRNSQSGSTWPGSFRAWSTRHCP
jgi:enoyl-CoA hydratase/carnithine racemase